jgi:hypothetical protein
VTSKADARARRFEKSARLNRRHEHAIIIDNESGKVVVGRIRGSRDAVQFSPEHGPELTGRVVSHNHPSGWDHPEADPRHAGIGFSDADVMPFIDFLPAELRAVTPGYLHRLRPRFDKNGIVTKPTTDANRRAVYMEISRTFERVEQELIEEVALGEMSEAKATVELNHRAVPTLRAILQVEYEREVLP